MQLTALLEDESAVTVRLALMSLKLCMSSLSYSYHSSLSIKLLFAVMQLKHNSYWLVKVSAVRLAFASVCVQHSHRRLFKWLLCVFRYFG